jgi:SAM-dependent methyltransferase
VAANSRNRSFGAPDSGRGRTAPGGTAPAGPGAGEGVLDIDSGPGLPAGELAAAVGPTGRVCGVDVSPDMLALARARDLPTGCAPVEYLAAGAERLPYPDDMFDLAVSTQVMEYVPDVAAALAEAYRVLRPGGRLLLLDTDWDSIVALPRRRADAAGPPYLQLRELCRVSGDKVGQERHSHGHGGCRRRYTRPAASERSADDWLLAR